jgi:hypothetical protein
MGTEVRHNASRLLAGGLMCCGGELYDDAKQCVLRDCRCYGRKHYLLRSGGPLSHICATPVTTNVLGGSGTDYALDSRTRNQWRQSAKQASDLIAE